LLPFGYTSNRPWSNIREEGGEGLVWWNNLISIRNSVGEYGCGCRKVDWW